jgi:hypothetical protein
MLSDLDELILSCEDPRSRKYIEEAVLCYKSGAYRSSVVACWIAVAFDLVDKIRELAAGGDKEAQAEIARFETIQKTNNLPGALAFEKELPLMAKEKFEFVSHIEYLDIVRLVEDRNKCAHPSQVSDNQVFSASAELARLHIYNAVNSILARPASQGKVSIARVLADLDSKFFPSKLEDVITLFEAGPLKRPRDSLFNNILKILMKTALDGDDAAAKFSKCSLALSAIKQIQPNLWDKFFPECIKQIVERIRTEEALCNAIISIVRLQKIGAWSALPKAEKLRILTFVENAPPELYVDLDWFYLVEAAPAELLSASSKRINKAEFSEIETAEWFFIPPQIFDRLTIIYAGASNFADANMYGRTLRNILQELEPTYQQADNLISIAAANDQIRFSNELPNVLRLLDSVEGGRATVEKLMIKHGLEIPI